MDHPVVLMPSRDREVLFSRGHHGACSRQPPTESWLSALSLLRPGPWQGLLGDHPNRDRLPSSRERDGIGVASSKHGVSKEVCSSCVAPADPWDVLAGVFQGIKEHVRTLMVQALEEEACASRTTIHDGTPHAANELVTPTREYRKFAASPCRRTSLRPSCMGLGDTRIENCPSRYGLPAVPFAWDWCRSCHATM